MKYDFFYLNNVYSPDQCFIIKKNIKNSIDKNLPDIPAPDVIKTANVGCFLYRSVKKDLENFVDSVLDINKHIFGFDLFQLSGYEVLNFNNYSEKQKGEYGWHNDSCDEKSRDIKLTALLNISTEEFEGGDIELFLNESKSIKEFRNPGTVLVFPSYVQHRVLPVTKGNRDTVSLFFSGPNFR